MTSDEFNVYFSHVVNAYTNFIGFINNNEVLINYKYLWDIVCMPGGLFEKGLNLIILNSPEDDITSRIELVCPTNQYSTNPYDINKYFIHEMDFLNQSIDIREFRKQYMT